MYCSRPEASGGRQHMTDVVQPRPKTRWYKRPVLWISGVILLVLAGFIAAQMGGHAASLRYSEFLDQLDADNVAGVTFAGTQIDARLRQPIVDKTSKDASLSSAFRTRIPDFGDPRLLSELRTKHVAIAVASSSQWFGVGGIAIVGTVAAVIIAKPMLLIIAAGFIAGLIRVMRGGKMDVRAILAMVPMFKSLAPEGAGKAEPKGNSQQPGEGLRGS